MGLALAPFWFGGNRPLAWGFHAVWFPATSVIYEIGRIGSAKRHPVALRRVWLPAICLGLVALWACVQMSSWIPAPSQHPIWQMTRDALGKDVPGAISINLDETKMALMKLITSVCLFWTTMQLCRAPERSAALIGAVALIGLAYAAYGIVAFFAFPRTILWYPKFFYNDSVTSTFVNRNSYATFAGMGMIAAMSMAFRRFVESDRAGGRAAKRRIASLVAAAAGLGGAWLAATFVIGVALVLTASRGGISATFGGALALLSLTAVRGRKNSAGVGFAILAALGVIGVAAFSFGDYFADRLASQGFSSDDRLAVYHLGLLSIGDAPLFGFGWGTFRQVLPMYRDSSLGPFVIWDLAHNSYLELFQGLGIPVAIVFLIGIAVLAARCVRGAALRKFSATAPLAAVAATFIVFLHAFVDFSLQMQAVTLTWTAMLAAGVAQSWSTRTATEQ